jgi:NAD(P)-dependent dehydrogenase (short-subunit alcohol dehydrogenase family)
MRTVIVGASSGLGRCLAVGLGKRGATVALMARRKDRLADAAGETGSGAVAIACDVTDQASIRSAFDQAADALGGIDALVYAVGIGPLVRLADTDVATWRTLFDTNVIGASLVTATAIPHLAASDGVAAYLSSTSASLTPAFPGLGAYAVSKAALNKLVEAWRGEYPGVGFTQVTVGDCAGGAGDSMTEFANGWDPALAVEMGTIWSARQYVVGSLLEVEELVRVVDTVLRCGASACIPTVAIVPRPPG